MTMTKRQKTTTGCRSVQEQQQNLQQPPQLHQTHRRRIRRRRPTTTTTTTATTAGATPSSLSSSTYNNGGSASVVLAPLSSSASSSPPASTSGEMPTSGSSSSSPIVQSITASVSAGGGGGGVYGILVKNSNDDATGKDDEKSSRNSVLGGNRTRGKKTWSSSSWAASLAFDWDVAFSNSKRLVDGLASSSLIHPNNIYRAGQRSKRKYGLSIVRSRAFNRHRNANDQNSTEVLFRNGRCNDITNTTPNAYVGCIFLGPCSSSSSSGDGKVLAMDCTGTIDIVDPGGYTSSPVVDTGSTSSNNNRSRGNIVRHHHHPHTRIDFAHYLANKTNNGRSSSSSMNGSSDGNINSSVDFSSVFLRGYGNSNNSSHGSGPLSSSIVAIGMTNDHLCLLELEDMVSSSISYSLSSSRSNYHGRHHHHYRYHPRNYSNVVPQTYVHHSFIDGASTATASSPSMINTNVREVWSTQQQVNRGRIFYRDRRNDRLVLREQLRKGQQQYLYNSDDNKSANGYNYYHHRGRHSSDTRLGDNISMAGRHNYLSDLVPISRQQQRDMSGTFVRFVPHLCPSMTSQWDVLETRGSGHLSSSCYHIAHVDSGSDCFWWQIFDGRTATSDSSVHKTNLPRLLVDLTSTDRPTKREEHITSVAIVSDICLATSHISCPSYGMTPAHEIFDRDLPYCGSGMESCVKLWDLRMLSCSNSASSYSRQQQPITTIPVNSSLTTEPDHHRHVAVQLPSFPDFDSFGVEPVETINGTLSSKGSLRFKDNTSRPYTIENRRTYKEGDGRKNKIAPGSGSHGCDYVITELTAMTQHSICNYGSTRCGALLITSTSRSRSSQFEHHNLDLGRMEVTRRPVTQNNRTSGSHPVFAIDNSGWHNDCMVCYSRLSSSSYLDLFDVLGNDDEVEPSSRLDLYITDRYGTETDLTCLAMCSTSVVGGSADGDLFIWR